MNFALSTLKKIKVHADKYDKGRRFGHPKGWTVSTNVQISH